jgi:hypothetical protein
LQCLLNSAFGTNPLCIVCSVFQFHDLLPRASAVRRVTWTED